MSSSEISERTCTRMDAHRANQLLACCNSDGLFACRLWRRSVCMGQRCLPLRIITRLWVSRRVDGGRVHESIFFNDRRRLTTVYEVFPVWNLSSGAACSKIYICCRSCHQIHACKYQSIVRTDICAVRQQQVNDICCHTFLHAWCNGVAMFESTKFTSAPAANSNNTISNAFFETASCNGDVFE